MTGVWNRKGKIIGRFFFLTDYKVFLILISKDVWMTWVGSGSEYGKIIPYPQHCLIWTLSYLYLWNLITWFNLLLFKGTLMYQKNSELREGPLPWPRSLRFYRCPGDWSPGAGGSRDQTQLPKLPGLLQPAGPWNETKRVFSLLTKITDWDGALRDSITRLGRTMIVTVTPGF